MDQYEHFFSFASSVIFICFALIHLFYYELGSLILFRDLNFCSMESVFHKEKLNHLSYIKFMHRMQDI